MSNEGMEATIRRAVTASWAKIRAFPNHFSEDEVPLLLADDAFAAVEAYLNTQHEKGRDCARTEEVLSNYRRRAIRAEQRVLDLEAYLNTGSEQPLGTDWLTRLANGIERYLTGKPVDRKFLAQQLREIRQIVDDRKVLLDPIKDEESHG